MPVFGFFALGRFLIRTIRLLWGKEAFRGLLGITLLVIFVGMWFYKAFEPSITTWVDAYYFTVITLTTIGYGDLYPTTAISKLVTTFYVVIGLGIMAGLIGLVGEVLIEDSKT